MDSLRLGKELRKVARAIDAVKSGQDKYYFTNRTIKDDRDFFIACRHWNSSTPIIPRRVYGGRPHARLGDEIGGGYFLVLNGVGIVVDPGYGFMHVLYNSYGYTILDVDVVFITHDHPDHWAELPNILNLALLASLKRDGRPVHEPTFYLNQSVSQLRSFFFSDTSACYAIGPGQIVPIFRKSDNALAAEVTGLRAFHNERRSPENNSPNAIGLHFEVKSLNRRCRKTGQQIGGLTNIAITSDTQFPSAKKLKQDLQEFTDADKKRFAEDYQEDIRGNRKIEVLAMHIGSLEKGLKNLDGDPREYLDEKEDNQVFYEGYHLGFAGCLRLLNMVFKKYGTSGLAILTEFGEELRGYRADLASALETIAEANKEKPNVRVIPADIGMALQLTWKAGDEVQAPRLRCSKCFRMKEAGVLRQDWEKTKSSEFREPFDPMDEAFFHPMSEMQVFEDLDTGLVQYCCRW